MNMIGLTKFHCSTKQLSVNVALQTFTINSSDEVDRLFASVETQTLFSRKLSELGIKDLHLICFSGKKISITSVIP